MKITYATKIIAASAVCMLAAPAFCQNITAAKPTPSASQAQPAQPAKVEGAWVRATVAGQKSTGAFMRITAATATRLVGVSSPVAGVAEVHEMKMNGDVMTMREAPSIGLAAGKALELKPGGYHVMLMDLKQPLPAGGAVALTLKFKDAAGVESSIALSVPVAKAAPAASAGAHKH